MKPETIEIVVSTLASMTTIIVSHQKTMKAQRRDFARHRLLHMIMEDQLNYEMFKQLPRNYSAILKDYDIYHKSGGNGEITLRVEAYKRWHDDIEQGKLKNS